MPVCTQDYTQRFVGEKPLLSMDFRLNLSPGETITTTSWAAVLEQGQDASPQNIISGAALISGTTTLQLIDLTSATVVAGNIYLLEGTVNTSAGQKVIGTAHLPVVAPS